MGRKPKIRASFYSDAQFLLRMANAISADRALPREWREAISDETKRLAVKLLNAPVRNLKAVS
jgi:hypothetical protein